MKFAFKKIGVVGIAGSLSVMSGAAVAKEITLGFVPASMIYSYNAAAAKGFQDAAKELGAKSIVVDPKGSVERQGNAIDDLITQKVDGISAIVLDSVVAQTWVDRVVSNNIVFVAATSPIGDPDKVPLRQVYSKLSALVAVDNGLAGELTGELAASLLPMGRVAKIGVIEGESGYAQVRQFYEGFKRGLANKDAKYKIVSSQPTDWTPEKGEAVCQNILASYPDLDLFYSQADDMALGCARAIQAVGSKAKLVSNVGGSKLGNNAIKNGEMDGSVCVKPETIGRLAAKALYEAITNKNTPKARFITYKLPVVTKATLAECPAEW
jgi:ribose transport system substrate-binding protein